VARKYSRGREVIHLEYEAYPEMAEKVMAEIGDEIKTRFPVSGVAIVHRTGVLAVGEASVVIAIAAPHRGEAFAASQYAIDRLKRSCRSGRRKSGTTAHSGSAGRTSSTSPPWMPDKTRAPLVFQSTVGAAPGPYSTRSFASLVAGCAATVRRCAGRW